MLNSDESKLGPIIFEYPFPMIVSIKNTRQNLNSILSMYATCRI